MRPAAASALLALSTLIATAHAGPKPAPAETASITWLKDLKTGLAEAAKTGKPIFLVTLWAPKL